MKDMKTKLIEDADKFKNNYSASIKKTYCKERIPTRIAILGRFLYNLSQRQEKLSGELGIICLTVTNKDDLGKERDRVSRLSSEIARDYLKLVVLTHELQLDCERSADRVIGAHANNDIELILDTDLEKN